MTIKTDEKFFQSLSPKIRAAVVALDEILKTDPKEFNTEELVQAWATLDYAHAMMRVEVYSRPDIKGAMVAAMEALNECGVVRH